MADLRIVDAPVLLQESITDDVKMPTGGLGNFSIRLGDIVWYVVTKEQLANKNYVDLSSKGVKDSLDVHIADKANPHQVTKEQVGLGNVDNTADIDKPVSNAVSSAIITATTDMATKTYVNSKDGDLTKLTTTDKTSLVKAINEVVSVKADKATTLVGYGISDAYTKSEIDTNYGGVKTLYDKNVVAGAGANGWDSNLVVYGETTQKQINDGLESIAQLEDIQNPRDGLRVYVKSYYAGLNSGGGTFVYDSTKASINDGGIVINGWVRQIESNYYLEFWGVISNNADQVEKIQKAIDYCQANDIKKLSAMGKDDYIINSTLIFKPVPNKVNWGYGDNRFVFDLNGGNLKTTNDNLTFIKLLRDHVKIINMGIFGTYGKTQRAFVFGYDLDETHVPNTRESVMWCELDNIKLGGLDIGMQFNPNYGSYGMYYHKINNVDARDVTILFYGEHTTSTQADIDAGRGANKVTRSNFTNITHNKGACSIFFKDIETCYFDIYAEDITKDDSRLPDGKAVFAYIPKAQDYNTLAYDNQNVEISGAVEVATRVFNFGQTAQGVNWNVHPMSIKDTDANAYINPHLAIDVSNRAKNIDNGSLNFYVNPSAISVKPVTMMRNDTPQDVENTYPSTADDIYGSVLTLPSTHQWSTNQVQLLADQLTKDVNVRFNFGDWFQLMSTANSFGLGSSWKFLHNQSLNNFRFAGGGLRIAQVSFDNADTTVAQSMPRPNHVYGAVLWVQCVSSGGFDGFQILLNVDPLNIYFRAVTGGTNFQTGTWTPWKTVTAS